MRPSRVAVVALIAATILPAAPLSGQIRASESSTLLQTIDGTVFRVDYPGVLWDVWADSFFETYSSTLVAAAAT